jgi:hypothetical protein
MSTQAQSLNTATRQPNSSTLRKALRANAIFSTISGIGFVLLSGPIADFLGLPGSSAAILILGIVIVAFAAGLFFITSREEIDRREALAVFVMDVAWVVISAVILLTGALSLTPAGSWAVLIVADMVAVFAIWEFVGIRRL